MSGDFSDKVVVVSGASSGLGLTAAILFSKRNASVVLCGRDEGRLKDALQQCVEASGGHAERFIYVKGDLTEAAIRQAIMDKTIEKFGRLDILVANAGVFLHEDGIENATEATFDAMFNINVKSVFFLIQAALPHLEKSAGNVVAVSSTGSSMAIPKRPIYPMTKACLDHMVRCLAFDLASKGIRVNSVNPAYVTTRMWREYDNFEAVASVIEKKEGPKHVLRGECITADDVANAIAFLASDDARCITGQCQMIDSGRHYMGSK